MTTTHSLELTIAHLNLIARVIPAADSVTVDRFGEIRIQGKGDDMAAAAKTLGLKRNVREDHASNAATFTIWKGQTKTAFGSFDTTVVMVGPVMVEMPADCYSAELT